VTASGALRGLLLKTGKAASLDGSTEVEIVENLEERSDETVADALLALVSQIRTLRILNREPAALI
jgi:hypothetical protein